MGEHARNTSSEQPDASSGVPLQTGGPGGTASRAEGKAECGVFDIRIDREGVWFYHGSPIGRKELVKLFASVLKRDPEGRYLLETPAERGIIEVEDAPFLAVEVTNAGTGRDRTLTFRTNLDEIVMAGPDHPLRIAEDAATGEPKPYLLVRDGLEALLTRSVYYELVECGAEETVQGEVRFGIWSGGSFFSLGSVES